MGIEGLPRVGWMKALFGGVSRSSPEGKTIKVANKCLNSSKEAASTASVPVGRPLAGMGTVTAQKTGSQLATDVKATVKGDGFLSSSKAPGTEGRGKTIWSWRGKKTDSSSVKREETMVKQEVSSRPFTIKFNHNGESVKQILSNPEHPDRAQLLKDLKSELYNPEGSKNLPYLVSTLVDEGILSADWEELADQSSVKGEQVGVAVPKNSEKDIGQVRENIEKLSEFFKTADIGNSDKRVVYRNGQFAVEDQKRFQGKTDRESARAIIDVVRQARQMGIFEEKDDKGKSKIDLSTLIGTRFEKSAWFQNVVNSNPDIKREMLEMQIGISMHQLGDVSREMENFKTAADSVKSIANLLKGSNIETREFIIEGGAKANLLDILGAGKEGQAYHDNATAPLLGMISTSPEAAFIGLTQAEIDRGTKKSLNVDSLKAQLDKPSYPQMLLRFTAGLAGWGKSHEIAQNALKDLAKAAIEACHEKGNEHKTDDYSPEEKQLYGKIKKFAAESPIDALGATQAILEYLKAHTIISRNG